MGCREPFSSLSHLLGAGVFAGLAVNLIRRGGNDWVKATSLAVFGATSVILLLLSGIYHVFWPGPTREFMLRADVSAVFLLIAGSMTPVHAILFTGLARWGALALIWFVAIAGIVWRMLFCENTPGPAGISFNPPSYLDWHIQSARSGCCSTGRSLLRASSVHTKSGMSPFYVGWVYTGDSSTKLPPTDPGNDILRFLF